MASDKRQFNNAVKHWEALSQDECLSLPREAGRVAIFSSYEVDTDKYNQPVAKQIRRYRKEAFALADLIVRSCRKPEVILNCDSDDFVAVLTDPEYSDIITIGHGNISAFDMIDGFFSWYDVSMQADHLKTGTFQQRQCGVFRQSLPVPLGTFCMTSASQVYAAVGEYFDPHGIHDPAAPALTQVTQSRMLAYDEIKRLPSVFLNQRVPELD